MNDKDAPSVTEVCTALKPDTLIALIEEFVTRDATDYGDRERTLGDKLEDVMRQLRRGKMRIVFDADSWLREQAARSTPERPLSANFAGLSARQGRGNVSRFRAS
jgi:uncharacterized protein YheU (UPF0270 family)